MEPSSVGPDRSFFLCGVVSSLEEETPIKTIDSTKAGKRETFLKVSRKNRMNILKILFLILGAIYLLVPSDLLPDFLVGFGWIDDIIVIGLLWWYYRRFSQPQRPVNHSDRGRDSAGEEKHRKTDSARNNSTDPYSVLGIAPGASPEEIKSAYRRLAAQYHPDKVQHLGKEIQALAEARFREIQQAYDALVSK